MYILANVPKDILIKLDEEINKTSLKKHNHHLTGNIKKELLIPNAKKYLINFLGLVIEKHKEKFETYENLIEMCDRDDLSFELTSLWVNFQKKHEFNPIHSHGGVYSFVIWHKIPYLIEDEIKQFPDMEESEVRAGQFAFVFPKETGVIGTDDLPVDKTWEGRIALFPSKLSHLVYPFYSSDEERITISGNLVLKV